MKRKYRITRAADFKRVRQSGKLYAHSLVSVIVAPGESESSRFGIIVGKAVGNAVMRNQVKRRIRAITDQYIQQINQKADILLVAKSSASTAGFQELFQAISYGLNNAKLLD